MLGAEAGGPHDAYLGKEGPSLSASTGSKFQAESPMFMILGRSYPVLDIKIKQET